MKTTKTVQEGRGIKERVLGSICRKIVKYGADPRGCWLGLVYEVELPSEIVAEMVDIHLFAKK